MNAHVQTTPFWPWPLSIFEGLLLPRMAGEQVTRDAGDYEGRHRLGLSALLAGQPDLIYPFSVPMILARIVLEDISGGPTLGQWLADVAGLADLDSEEDQRRGVSP